RERPAGRAVRPEPPCQGPAFDRVAGPGPGAVRLHVVQVAGPQAGRVERGAQDAFLRRSAGGAESLAAAVLVARRALDHGEDPVAVAPGVGEALEEDQAA